MAEICITVCYSPSAGKVQELELRLPAGATLQDAFNAASTHAAPDFFTEILATSMFGIWGKLSKPEQVLRSGDRVECYRPLTVDPKVARRERFARQGAKSAGLFSRSRPGAKAGY